MALITLDGRLALLILTLLFLGKFKNNVVGRRNNDQVIHLFLSKENVICSKRRFYFESNFFI